MVVYADGVYKNLYESKEMNEIKQINATWWHDRLGIKLNTLYLTRVLVVSIKRQLFVELNFRHLLYLVCNIPSSTDIRAKVAPPLTPGSTNRRILCDNDLCTRATFVVCYGYVARIVLQIVYINEFVMCKRML